ncbi:MAG: murein biosynthesis integral membrane protein MurJ [Phycisphaerae bacterium]
MPTAGRFIASARWISILTLGSRVFGLLREIVFAGYFSTSELMSAFRIAFMIPNLARRLFGEGALSSAMIPVLAESSRTGDEIASRRFVGSLLIALVIVLAGGVVVAEVILAGGRLISDDPALQLTAIMMPYMVLICTTAVAGGVLNARDHFATPAAVPILLNLTVILAVVGGAAWGGLTPVQLIHVASVAVVVAGFLQLIATAVALRAVSFFPIFRRRWYDPRLRRVAGLMLPMALGLSAVQLNAVADYSIAYLFIRVDGQRVGPAVLGFAQFLYQLPLGVFGIAVATAIFPILSRTAAADDRVAMTAIFQRGLRLSLFIALPATVGLMFVAQPLVSTLYQRRAFDAADAQRVAGTLFFYSLGLTAYFVQHLLVRAFYALHDSRTPARVAIRMVGVNLGLNLILVRFLEERGLALATACCAMLQTLWLSRSLRRTLPGIGSQVVVRGIQRSLAATAVMVLVLFITSRLLLDGTVLGAHSGVRLTVLVVAGVVSYVVAARLLRIDELGWVLGSKRWADSEEP